MDRGFQEAIWRIPILDFGCELTLSLRPAASSGEWELRGLVRCPTDAGLPGRIRIEVVREDDLGKLGEVELSGPLDESLAEPVRLEAGNWSLLLHLEKQLRRIPLLVGRPCLGLPRREVRE